jgi:nicotinamidase-related amidase
MLYSFAMKNIILIIDWQNAYFPIQRDEKYMEQAVEKTATLVREARKHGDQVAWIALTCDENPHVFDNTCDEFFDAPPSSFRPELIDVHQENDPLFLKSRSDGFPGINPSTDGTLGEWLEAQEFDQLIFTGFHIGDCVNATLQSALRAGYGPKCVVARDACGDGPTPFVSYSDIFNQTHLLYGGHVCSAARVLQSLQNRTAVDKHIHFSENTKPNPRKDRACLFPEEFEEIREPENVLRRYASSQQLKHRGHYSPSQERYTDEFMAIWARVNGFSEDEIKTLQTTDNQYEHFRLLDKLELRSKPTPL